MFGPLFGSKGEAIKTWPEGLYGGWASLAAAFEVVGSFVVGELPSVSESFLEMIGFCLVDASILLLRVGGKKWGAGCLCSGSGAEEKELRALLFSIHAIPFYAALCPSQFSVVYCALSPQPFCFSSSREDHLWSLRGDRQREVTWCSESRSDLGVCPLFWLLTKPCLSQNQLPLGVTVLRLLRVWVCVSPLLVLCL